MEFRCDQRSRLPRRLKSMDIVVPELKTSKGSVREGKLASRAVRLTWSFSTSSTVGQIWRK